VNVESDILNSIHGVLLIEISESAAANSRSQQCNLEENPFSLRSNPFFQHLYIQTDGSGTLENTKIRSPVFGSILLAAIRHGKVPLPSVTESPSKRWHCGTI
jgi:hypothetical protein